MSHRPDDDTIRSRIIELEGVKEALLDDLKRILDCVPPDNIQQIAALRLTITIMDESISKSKPTIDDWLRT